MKMNYYEILKDLLVDPILYLPALLIILIILLLYKYKKDWIDRRPGIFMAFIVLSALYFLSAAVYANYSHIKIIEKNELRKLKRYTLAVLCFDNVSRDDNNNRDCNMFRYCLTRAMKIISEPHGIEVFDVAEVREINKLSENPSLTINKAIQLGTELGVGYVVFGDISPINDILVNLKLIDISSKKKVLEFEIRRRLTNIQSLAGKASEQLLHTFRTISLEDKKKTRNRLSSVKTCIRAAKLFSDGLDAFYRKDFPKAISFLEKAIKEDKEFADPHLLLAYIYFYQKKDKLAIDQLKARLSKQPDWPDAHYFLGVVYKRIGNYGEARKKYQDAIKFESRLVYRMIYKTALAGIYLKMGKKKESQSIIAEIEETATKHKKILYNLAARYCELGNLDKSLSLLEEAKRSGLSSYDCKAALDDPDFRNFRSDPEIHIRFLKLMQESQ
jgi:tetratricopeptide (TPR) repeat protein